MRLRTIGIRVLNSLIPVVLAFFIGGIIIVAIGENPFSTYGILIRNSLFTPKGFLQRCTMQVLLF